MKNQPNRDYISNDIVQTPPELCKLICEYYKPYGAILEPCSGDGHFVDELKKYSNNIEFGDVLTGQDFLAGYWKHSRFDYIICNFPWSKIRDCMRESYKISERIISLITVNHVFTKARIRDMREAGFHVSNILLLPMPKEFPQSGFQLGAVEFSRVESNLCLIDCDYLNV